MADTNKTSLRVPLAFAAVMTALSVAGWVKPTPKNAPEAEKIESIESIAAANNISTEEFKIVKKALGDLLIKPARLSKHTALVKETGSDQFAIDDAIDKAHIAMALEFLNNLAKKKNLGPADEVPGIEVTENSISTNVELYMNILQKLVQEQNTEITR